MPAAYALVTLASPAHSNPRKPAHTGWTLDVCSAPRGGGAHKALVDFECKRASWTAGKGLEATVDAHAMQFFQSIAVPANEIDHSNRGSAAPLQAPPQQPPQQPPRQRSGLRGNGAQHEQQLLLLPAIDHHAPNNGNANDRIEVESRAGSVANGGHAGRPDDAAGVAAALAAVKLPAALHAFDVNAACGVKGAPPCVLVAALVGASKSDQNPIIRYGWASGLQTRNILVTRDAQGQLWLHWLNGVVERANDKVGRNTDGSPLRLRAFDDARLVAGPCADVRAQHWEAAAAAAAADTRASHANIVKRIDDECGGRQACFCVALTNGAGEARVVRLSPADATTDAEWNAFTAGVADAAKALVLKDAADKATAAREKQAPPAGNGKTKK